MAKAGENNWASNAWRSDTSRNVFNPWSIITDVQISKEKKKTVKERRKLARIQATAATQSYERTVAWEARLNPLRREVQKNLKAIKVEASKFNRSFESLLRKAKRTGRSTSDIDALRKAVTEVIRLSSELEMTANITELEQDKIDTASLLWVVRESNTRLDLFRIQQSRLESEENEEIALAQQQARLLEIAARETEIRDARVAFAVEAEIARENIKILRALKLEIAAAREGLRRDLSAIKAAERELGLARV